MKPYYDEGGITIYHGDCRDVLPQIEQVEAVVTDPPYSISLAGISHESKPGKGTRRLDFFEGDSDWAAMTEIAATGVNAAAALAKGSVYAFCGHRQFGRIVEVLELTGWATRPIGWVKKCPVPAPPGSGWASGLEMCVYAYKPGRVFNGDGIEPNVLYADSYRHGQPGKVDHPTQKPLGLVRHLIEVSTDAGQQILDPFMGSGTTLRAAKDIGRNAIGIEIEERFCEIAADRLSQEVLDFGAVA